MAPSAEKFAQLLTAAIYRIRIAESKTIKKTISLIQDELGYSLGREGGSCIEYWRKGYVPAKLEEVEMLARALARRGGLEQPELTQFLASAGHPNPAGAIERLFPSAAKRRAQPVSAIAAQTGGLTEVLAPFVVGPPITRPRQFFGRAQELNRIFGVWKHFPLQNVAVIGRHRAGKTSLLHYLATICTSDPAQLRPNQRTDWLTRPEQYRWVFVDFQDARMGRQERLLRYLLASFDISASEPVTLNYFLDLVSDQLRQPTIVLMDEIGAGLASPELDQQFWWSLRSLGSNYTGGRLGFVLTAPDAPELLAHEYGKPSPFFNIFGHIVNLGPFTESEARALIGSSPRPFGKEDVDWIVTQSGGWPALIQILCDTYLTALTEGQVGQAWRSEGLRRLEPFSYLLTQIER